MPPSTKIGAQNLRPLPVATPLTRTTKSTATSQTDLTNQGLNDSLKDLISKYITDSEDGFSAKGVLDELLQGGPNYPSSSNQLQEEHNELKFKYQSLEIEYSMLQIEFNELKEKYERLLEIQT